MLRFMVLSIYLMMRRRNAVAQVAGTAICVSSSISPLAPASDGGAPVIQVASFNGLIGLKPTRGQFLSVLVRFTWMAGASVQFALTKSVRDTKRLLYHTQTCQMERSLYLAKLAKESLEQPIRPLKI